MRAAQCIKRGVAVRLWFVTRQAFSPSGGVRLDIDHAALCGAARVLSDERPDLWGGILDLPTDLDHQSPGGRRVSWLQPGNEDQVAVRDNRVLAPRIVSAERVPGAALQWRADSAYLITGGFGDVGLAIARAMIEEGARRLILAGRSGLPERSAWRGIAPHSMLGKRIAAVRQLEALAHPSIALRSTLRTTSPCNASLMTMLPKGGPKSGASYTWQRWS